MDFILVIVLQTHALQKFQGDGRSSDADDEDDFPERPIGFTADIK